MEEETKEAASDVAEQTDEFIEEANNFDQQEVSLLKIDENLQYDLETTMG